MAADKPEVQAMEEYIAELEMLIAKWQGATDPESRWVLRLLRQAKEEAAMNSSHQPHWLRSMLH